MKLKLLIRHHRGLDSAYELVWIEEGRPLPSVIFILKTDEDLEIAVKDTTQHKVRVYYEIE